jgi:hypothetical protein
MAVFNRCSANGSILIRPEQMSVFRNQALHDFEEELVSVARTLDPELCRRMDHETLRAVVSRSRSIAATRYGFINRGPARLFVELACLLGFEFDTDPLLPRLRAAIQPDELLDQGMRAELVYSEARAYLYSTVGLTNQN